MEILNSGNRFSQEFTINEALKTAPVTSNQKAIYVLRRNTKNYELFNPFTLDKADTFPERRSEEIQQIIGSQMPKFPKPYYKLYARRTFFYKKF